MNFLFLRLFFFFLLKKKNCERENVLRRMRKKFSRINDSISNSTPLPNIENMEGKLLLRDILLFREREREREERNKEGIKQTLFPRSNNFLSTRTSAILRHYPHPVSGKLFSKLASKLQTRMTELYCSLPVKPIIYNPFPG